MNLHPARLSLARLGDAGRQVRDELTRIEAGQTVDLARAQTLGDDLVEHAIQTRNALRDAARMSRQQGAAR